MLPGGLCHISDAVLCSLCVTLQFLLIIQLTHCIEKASEVHQNFYGMKHSGAWPMSPHQWCKSSDGLRGSCRVRLHFCWSCTVKCHKYPSFHYISHPRRLGNPYQLCASSPESLMPLATLILIVTSISCNDIVAAWQFCMFLRPFVACHVFTVFACTSAGHTQMVPIFSLA